jgi:hypothetical protein
MDKKTAITNALERLKIEQEEQFKDRVRELVSKIGRKSQELRELKAELTSLEYVEPKIEQDVS